LRPYNQGSDFPTLLALIIAVGFPLLLLSLVFDIFPRDQFDDFLRSLRLPWSAQTEPRPSPSPLIVRQPSPTPVVLTSPDWAMPSGYFFTQTNGQPALASATGFPVTNAGGLAFWDEFQRLGGVEAVGYPLSNRFTWRGFTIQVFQRLVLQGPEQGGEVSIVNLMQELSLLGKDDWLREEKLVPPPLPIEFDAGVPPENIAAHHLALLADDPAIEQFYRESKDGLQRFGLPTSKVTDLGDYLVAIRCQRTVLQRWKQDGPWGKAGVVTIANAGELAVQAGLFPSEGFRPIASAPPQPAPAASPNPQPSPSPAP
jgi:hypothetical protein